MFCSVLMKNFKNHVSFGFSLFLAKIKSLLCVQLFLETRL